MSYKLENENISMLNLMAQILEATNSGLVNFYNENIVTDFNAKKITQSTFDIMSITIRDKVEKNSEYINFIEKEIMRRVKTKLKEITLPNDFDVLKNKYQKLFEEDAKILNVKKIEKDVVKLNNRGNTGKTSKIKT